MFQTISFREALSFFYLQVFECQAKHLPVIRNQYEIALMVPIEIIPIEYYIGYNDVRNDYM